MPAPLPVVLPEALKIARKAAGKSQAQVAQEAGISAGYVAMIELGKRHPTIGVVMSIARVLNVPVTAFALADETLLETATSVSPA